MTLVDPFPALALPPEALVDRRVPKKLLTENGAPTAKDKRLIRERIEELRWLAALKPATIGVAEYRDSVREYLEIAVLKLLLRLEGRPDQVIKLVHRAVPYPVLLIVWWGDTVSLSMAHKRRSLSEADKTVIDGEIVAARLAEDCPDRLMVAFQNALALTRQPRSTLHALYQGWVDTLQALRVAGITGTFSLPASAISAVDRTAALQECLRLNRKIAEVCAAASKERQVSRRVELNLELARLRTGLEAARERL